jgi:hypothetical protein
MVFTAVASTVVHAYLALLEVKMMGLSRYLVGGAVVSLETSGLVLGLIARHFTIAGGTVSLPLFRSVDNQSDRQATASQSYANDVGPVLPVLI